MSNTLKKGIVEALIFASPRPIDIKTLVGISSLEGKDEAEKIVEELNRAYESEGRAFRIKAIAGGFQFFTLNSYAPYVAELFAERGKLRLTRAMLEVLSIIALKQPVTKPVIDRIRGADSSGSVHRLLEGGVITMKGRQKAPGRPFLYGTTEEFLKLFGLESVRDLPNEEDLRGLFEEKAQLEEIDESGADTAGPETSAVEPEPTGEEN